MSDPVGWLGLALAIGTAVFWVGVAVGNFRSRVSQIGHLKKRVADLERAIAPLLRRPYVPRMTDDDVEIHPGDGGLLDAERTAR